MSHVNVTGAAGSTLNNCDVAGIKNELHVHQSAIDLKKLEKNTLARITSWTADMVKTAALALLLSMIESGSRWVTVRGSPGEGKTTLSYQALQEVSSAGRRVFQVWKPEELAAIMSECQQPAVIMLDDMFGGLEFDPAKWKKWEIELHKVLGDTEHHSLEQPYKVISKKDIIVIVVGRDYVFNSATGYLGKYSPFFTEAKHVINLTKSYKRDVQEKMSIWETLSEAGGVELDKEVVEKICNIDGPHGFPHVCRLFITMLRQGLNLKAEEFFKSPLEFLNQTIAKFMRNTCLFVLFKEMIVGDGRVSVRELGQLDNGHEIIESADYLVGSYLKKQDFVFEFDHPSVFDSVALRFCKSHLDVVIQRCPMSFLHGRVRLEPLHGTPSSENSLVVYIQREYRTELVKRFVTEVSNRNFSKVLSHKAMRDVDFVKEFISSLTYPLQFMYETDVNFVEPWYGITHCIRSNEGTFLYYIPSSQSPLLLKHIERHTKTQLSTHDIETVLVGACSFAAWDVLTYLMKRYRIDINMQLGKIKQTPLMIAAKSNDSGFVDTILDMKPDVAVKDDEGRTILHHLCYCGIVSAVSRVIDIGCDVNEKCRHGESPLSAACRGNQTAVVRVLLDRGARVDSRAVKTACESGNLDIVTLLFDRGATVDMNTIWGSPLHSACCGRSLLVMEYLIEKGASVNKASRINGTPLHMACLIDWHQGVRCLLKHGADIYSRDCTPLHVAAWRGSHTCIEVLLSGKANVNIQDKEGRTSLFRAAWSRSHECVKMLLSAKANANIPDKDGRTPLHMAAWSRSRECVELLMSAKANDNIQTKGGSTPLHVAAQNGSRECVEVLLSGETSVNIQNKSGRTPLHAAAQNGSHECVEVLLSAEANVNILDKGGSTPLHAAAQNGSHECVEVLLSAEANVNIQDKRGNTALHVAAQNGSHECVEVLLSAEANVNILDKGGSTPLHAAAQNGSHECVEVLLSAEANVNIQDKRGNTALHVAAQNGSHECVEVLLSAEANANIQDKEGNTPLHVAAQNGSHECVKMLLSAEANVNMHDKKGRTPLHVAAQRESHKCIEMLIHAGADQNIEQ